MAKITITIWDEDNDLAVAAVDFDPPIPEDAAKVTQAQQVAMAALFAAQHEVRGSRCEGMWTDREGWIDGSDR